MGNNQWIIQELSQLIKKFDKYVQSFNYAIVDARYDESIKNLKTPFCWPLQQNKV